ncbi:MAG TPA: hypothetical protein VET23_01745 [Chitinophagaceae bacterium]|nr:hypothetical protein [Chitinophagaceae bacterium]
MKDDVQELFGNLFYSKPSQDEKNEITFFYENGKDILNSPTMIEIDNDHNIGRDVKLDFFTERK